MLRIGVFADNLSVINDDGSRRHLVSGPFKDEMAWAARRGREIVREGLADVIAWLGESR